MCLLVSGGRTSVEEACLFRFGRIATLDQACDVLGEEKYGFVDILRRNCFFV